LVDPDVKMENGDGIKQEEDDYSMYNE